MRLILASRSASRRALLTSAGVEFEAIAADLDETAVKARHEGTPAALALRLAELKALALFKRGLAAGDDLVIGGDQVLEFEAEAFEAPGSREEAAARLERMAGHTHHLRGGLVLAQRGEAVWRHESTAALTMRAMGREAIDAYLDAAGEGVLATVGAYELEGLGARLFERVEGDHFAILGLDLLPLLAELCRRGALPW